MNTTPIPAQLVAAAPRTEHRRLSAYELEEVLSDPNRWIPDTVAQFVLGIPSGTLRRYRHEGRGPRYARYGVRCRYKVAWLLEYLEQRIVETRDTARPKEAA